MENARNSWRRLFVQEERFALSRARESAGNRIADDGNHYKQFGKRESSMFCRVFYVSLVPYVPGRLQ